MKPTVSATPKTTIEMSGFTLVLIVWAITGLIRLGINTVDRKINSDYYLEMERMRRESEAEVILEEEEPEPTENSGEES